MFCVNTSNAQHFPLEFYNGCATEVPIETTSLGGENQTCQSLGLSLSSAAPHLPYIPTVDDPIITVKVNILFISDDSGFGHFDPTDTEAMEVWSEIEASVNQTYANLVEPAYTGDDADCEDTFAPFVDDTKIQFEFNNVFINNTELFDASQTTCTASSIRTEIQPLLDQLYPELKCNNAINLVMPTDLENLNEVLIGGSADGCFPNNANLPSYSDLERVEYLHLPNKYSKYLWMRNNLPFSAQYPNYGWDPTIKGWFINSTAREIEHEIGHCLGLHHFNAVHESNDCIHSILHQTGDGTPNYLPASEIGKMHRALAHSSVRSKVTLSSYSTTPIEITGTEVWDTNRKMYRPITVKDGGELKVTCTLRMHPQAKIIVEQGGLLTIDGGVITNYCDQTWAGIEVWGNTSLPQTASNQGRLIMRNEAVLSNAHNAVKLMKHDDWGQSGGYIQATNSYFINNKRSVEFLAYQNIQNNGFEAGNRSYFSRCTFENNDDFLIPEQGNFDMITMYKVKGVGIFGCFFENKRTVSTAVQRKGAIQTIDANFRVSTTCGVLVPYGTPCPEADKIKNTFTGFDVAIRAAGAEWNVGPEIKEAIFDQNMVGIEFDAAVAPSAIFNEMTVGNSPFAASDPNSPDFHLGVKVNNCDEYIVEENTFTGDDSNGWLKHGVYTFDEVYSTNSNELYKNDYTNMSSATIASGNHADPGTQSSFIGLRFVCNQNQGNTNDFELREFQGGPSEVSNYQHGGTPAVPAGNTFSNGTTGDGIYTHLDFFSNSAYSYLIQTGATDPVQDEVVITSPGTITPTYTPTANTCATNYPEPGKVVDVLFHTGKLTTEREAYNNLYYTYLQLIDQGNTDGMIAEIDLTWPQNAWDLHAELMARSPNNSQAVIISAVEKNILSHGMLLEILLANPDVLTGGGVITFLQNMVNPMPAYMIDILILAATNPGTARSVTERTLSNLHLEMVRSHKKLVNHYMNDTLNGVHPDTLMRYFGSVRTLQGRYQQIYGYTTFGEYANAQVTIDSVRTNYRLSQEQQLELDNTEDFVDFLKSLNSAGRNTAQLNATEIAELQTIATKIPGGMAAERAENVLCFFYDYCLDDAGAPKNNTIKTKKPKQTLDEALRDAIQMTVSPNPADFFIEFEYDVLLPSTQNVIRIYDIQGKPVETISLGEDVRGIKVLDTRNLPNGVYIYELLKDNEQVKSGKFVIQH
ncbi:MAG: hypothetical protein ACJAQ4_000665 [Cryomorphaceae bacterium]